MRFGGTFKLNSWFSFYLFLILFCAIFVQKVLKISENPFFNITGTTEEKNYNLYICTIAIIFFWSIAFSPYINCQKQALPTYFFEKQVKFYYFF